MAKAAELLWLLLALAGIAKMDVALRQASAATAAMRVPGALRGWTYALAFFLFAYGFVRTFVAFWNPPAMVFVFYRAGYLGENVPVWVLPVAFELLALLSVVKVAQGLGGVLRHPEAYGIVVVVVVVGGAPARRPPKVDEVDRMDCGRQVPSMSRCTSLTPLWDRLSGTHRLSEDVNAEEW